MTELPIPHQRGDPELPFPRKGFRIDHKPGFSFRAKDVAGVKILVKQHLFALGLGKILEGVESSIKQTLSNGRPARVQSSVSRSAHRDASSVKEVKGGPTGFHKRGRRAIPTSRALSGSSCESRVPGRHRSRRSARRSASRASSSTAPSPFHLSSAAPSCRLSRSGNWIFRTDSIPLGSVAGIASEAYA
jgi:hypothetical protein